MQQNITNLLKKLVTRKNLLILAALIVIYIILTRNAQDTKKITLSSVEKKSIAQTVSASGVVRSRNQADIRFQTAGRIAYINASQGDYVKKYQIVASLDTQDLQKRLKEDLNLYLNQRLDFEDTKDSLKDKPITDSLRRIAQRAQDKLDNAVIDVELRDLAIKFASVYSPIDGYIVTNPKVFVGSNVLPTDTIATVANLSSLEFVGQIDETSVGKISQGQKTTVTLDAFSDDKIETTVARISPVSVITSTGSTAFEAVFNLDQNTNYRIGMNGTADITIQKADSTLIVPQGVLQDKNTLWLKVGKNYQKKTVKGGIESDTEVEITEGLAENDQVVTSGFDQLSKGSILQKILKKL